MPRLILLSIILTALLLTGCNTEEEQVPAAEPSQQEDHGATQTDQSQPAMENAGQEADSLQEELEDAGEEVADTAQALGHAAAEKTEQAAAKVAEETEEAGQAVEQQVEEAEQTVADVDVPDIVTLEASFGNISFPHAVHADFLECTECHGSAEPGPMELGKDKGHELCQGCHKDQGAGPTGCRDCHKK